MQWQPLQARRGPSLEQPALDVASEQELLRDAGEQASAPQFEKLTELLQRQTEDVDEPERTARVEAVLADLHMLMRDAKPSSQYPWEEASQYFDYALHLVVAEFCGNLPMRETLRRCWSCVRPRKCDILKLWELWEGECKVFRKSFFEFIKHQKVLLIK